MTSIVDVKPEESNRNQRGNHDVQVFVRIRPLIAEEDGHKRIDFRTHEDSAGGRQSYRLEVHQTIDSTPITPETFNPNFAGAPPLRHRKEGQWKKFHGFDQVLTDTSNNTGVYQSTIQPLVAWMATQTSRSACVFSYGHTGSGKSHTLLGYGDEIGLCKLAAADLFRQLSLHEEPDKAHKRVLLVRVTELYKSTVKDLLTQSECSIRQDANGIVQVRGPMQQDAQGRMEQQPLGQLCSNANEVLACIELAVKHRQVGISTHHSQSSRSHLLIELEVVTEELVEQRNLFLRQDAHLTRLKWLETELVFRKDSNHAMPAWTDEYTTAPSKLGRETRQYEELVKATQQRISQMEETLGGTLVFCDLAGNEYARDGSDSTKEQRDEAASINQNLLAVKEMMRGLGKPGRHVPYRDSKLTMMLLRHLKHNKAIMMAHVSPSQESWKKTINTLTYASLVAGADSTTTSSRQGAAANSVAKKGKENRSSSRV